MQTKRYDMILMAQSPIAHHSESFGNSAVLMRRKTRLVDGSIASLPVLTGDTMRHGLREAGAYAFLDAAGLLDSGHLTEPALRLLFSGGMVTGKGDAGTIKLDDFRRMSELCPTLALLGGCADSRVIPGRIQVDDAILVCEEQRHFLPEWATEWLSATAVDTHRAYVEEAQRVRMDPTLDPGKVKLLGTGDQVEVAGRLTSSERAHETSDALAREDSKSSMMPRRFERIISGSLFYWSLTATCYSELDVDTLHVMMAAFLSRAVVGGKRGTGHGRITVAAMRDVKVHRPQEAATDVSALALAAGMGDLFRKHVADRREQIKDWLGKVDA